MAGRRTREEAGGRRRRRVRGVLPLQRAQARGRCREEWRRPRRRRLRRDRHLPQRAVQLGPDVPDRLARVPDNVPLVSWFAAQRRRRVRRRLLREQGVMEVVVDEVHHHWVIYLPVVLELVGVLALLWLLLFSSTKSGWVLFVLAVGLLGHALWRWATHFMDVFVVTDLRVLRLTG